MITFRTHRNIGDIIYSLPFCRAVAKESGDAKFNYIITVNYPANYSPSQMFEGSVHPAGNVTVTKKLADIIAPLLKNQSYINDVIIMDSKERSPQGTIELENFMRLGLDLKCGNISMWYEDIAVMKRSIDIWNPWLKAPKIAEYKDTVVLVRSQRYWGILDYSLLQPYVDRIVFIGIDSEYESIVNKIGVPVKRVLIHDFLEAAKIMTSCKFVIGNQTSLYAIAEGLKVPRLLEQSLKCPNVQAYNNGHSCVNNVYFKEILKLYMK